MCYYETINKFNLLIEKKQFRINPPKVTKLKKHTIN